MTKNTDKSRMEEMIKRHKSYGLSVATAAPEAPQYVATLPADMIDRITDHTQQTSIKWAQRAGEMHGRIESLEGERDMLRTRLAY